MNRREPQDSTRGPWRRLNAALTCVLLSAPFFVVQLFGSGSSREAGLPISIRAASQADYGQDAQTFLIPPIDEKILDQIISDGPATYNVRDPVPTSQLNFSSPVPATTDSAHSLAPTPTLLPQTPTSTGTALTTRTSTSALTSIGTLATTPRVDSTPTALPATKFLNTPVNISQPGLPLPTVITIPSSVPTNLPLPTVPQILPTILPTIPPILPTVPTLLPTTVSALPTIPPLLP